MVNHIAFLNFKGGVGKTTSVVNVGAGLARSGKRVLLVDLDAQHNLTQSFAVEEPEKTVYDALIGKTALPVMEVGERLYLSPNGLKMVKAEMELVSQIKREYFLRRSLAPILNDFDYILFDCPPALGLITANALFAADDVRVFVPIESEFLSLKGYTILNEALENLEMEVARVFLTKYDRRKVLNRSVRQAVCKQLKERAFDTCIRENVSLAECPSSGQTIFDYAPTSTGAQDYARLTNEILKYFDHG
jgi:chromosome partitioning protein